MARHRWEWPEGPKRLTEWLSTSEVRELAGAQATTGSKEGRRVELDGEQAWVERRASQEGETGKYRYRLVSNAALSRHYKRMDRSKWVIDEPDIGVKTYMGYNRNYSLRLCVRFPYDEALIARVKGWGAKWESEYRVWELSNPDVFEEALEYIHDYYSLGKQERGLIVMLSPKLVLPELVQHTSVNMLDRALFTRRRDWTKVRCKRGVHIVGEDLLEDDTYIVVERVRSSCFDRAVQAHGGHVLGVLNRPPEQSRSELRLCERLVLEAVSQTIEQSSREVREMSPDDSILEWIVEPFEPAQPIRMSLDSPASSYFSDIEGFDY